MKSQNELRGNSIDWSLTVLQKENEFTKSDSEIKRAILQEISLGDNKKPVGTIITEVHTRILALRTMKKALDELYKASQISEDFKLKYYTQVMNQIAGKTLLEPFIAKGFNCSEWQLIVAKFKPKVRDI